MKKKLIKIIILIVLVMLIGGFYWLKKYEAPPVNILKLYGNVDIRQVHLAFHDTGRIKNILVHEGDRVKTGELIAVMEPGRYEANLQKLTNELESRKQVLDRLLAGSRPQEIDQIKARVRADKAKLEDVKLRHDRLSKLAKTQYVSKQELDDATAALKAAREELKASEAGLNLAVVGPRQEDINAARFLTESAKAAVDLARQELADTKLYAPSDGIVQDRIMEPGDMAFPATPVLTLALDTPLWIRAYVPEASLGKIAQGMKAEISTDSFPGKTYHGWIGFISPTAEFTPKNVETPELRARLVYQVRVYVNDPQNEFRLGMPATVSIRLDQQREGDQAKRSLDAGGSK